jgi:general secretion pathway protein D
LVAALFPGQPVLGQVDGDTPVQLTFDNADLNEVINFVAETLSISIMVDPQVTGRVNIKMDKPIKKRDLFAVFESILRMNNTTIVKTGLLYQIVPISSSVKLPSGVYDYSDFVGKLVPAPSSQAGPSPSRPAPPAATPTPAPGSQPAPAQPTPLPVPPIPSAKDSELFSDGELAIHIIPVEFLPVNEMQQLIAPFLSNGGTMVIYQKANLLIITDFKDNVRRLRQIISALDGRIFDSTYIDLIKIKYYQVKEVAEDLAKVISGSAKSLDIGVTIVPIERLNSVLVVANSARALEKVHSWIDRLDTPQGRSQQTFIYQVQNSTANNIATILSQLYSEGGAQGSTTSGGAARPAQGLSTRGSQQQQSTTGLSQPQQLGPQLKGSLDLGAGGSGGPGGAVKIIVDELNNSLVIQATEPDYEYILKTIRMLDVLPRQVLIEAKIFQVSLTDELSMGVQWFFEKLGGVKSSGSGSSATANTRIKRTTVGAISRAAEGKPIQLGISSVFQVMNAKQLAADLIALRNITQVKVLEAPTVLALDGHEAKIEVGEEVPISTSTLSTAQQMSTNQSFFNQIQYRPTGVILVVNPRITASGMVTMEIAQEVSQAANVDTLTPKVSKSSVNTSLVVKDGEGVVIAGVIRENVSTGRSRVPVLGDIPILGYMFGHSSRSINRTEIVVILTPYVVRDPDQHKLATMEYEDQFQDIRNLIRSKQREFEKRRSNAEKENDREKRKLEEQQEKKLQERERQEQLEAEKRAKAEQEKRVEDQQKAGQETKQPESKAKNVPEGVSKAGKKEPPSPMATQPKTSIPPPIAPIPDVSQTTTRPNITTPT